MSVIEAGAMGKAAGRLDMSQPAVSKAIADIEHTLGVRLVDRSRRGVEPTPHGLALTKRGAVIFNELRQGVQEIEYLADPTAGELRIGATHPVAAAIVAPIIKQLVQQYRRMAFHVVVGDATMGSMYQNMSLRSVEFLIARIAGSMPKEYLAGQALALSEAREKKLVNCNGDKPAQRPLKCLVMEHRHTQQCQSEQNEI